VTAVKAVVDANVFVRSAVQRSTDARRWLDAIEAEEVDGHVSELVYAEVANSLLKYVRADKMTVGDAVVALETVVALPLRTHRLAKLAPGALALAVETGLSAYDCCYAVLSESMDAPLVTADRRLAAAVRSAELVE
jgi:predicted nucleic acid-binding protein